jgi:plastocyanin
MESNTLRGIAQRIWPPRAAITRAASLQAERGATPVTREERMNIRVRITLAAFAAVRAGAVAAAARGQHGGGGGGGGASVVTIHLTSANRFSPGDVTITPGTTVRWVADTGGHTVTPDNAAQAGVWASAALNAAGATFQHTFTTVGDFNYHCIPHQSLGMTGTVHVR